MARADRAPRALAEPARRTSLGPRPRPPMARQARCPRRKGAGPGAGWRASWAGPVPRHPNPHPLAPHRPRQASRALGPPRPNLCLLRSGRGTGPNAHRLPARPGLLQSSFLLSRLYMGATGVQRARRAGLPSQGAQAPRATVQLPRPGLGQAEPLACRRQGPPAPTSLPCQALAKKGQFSVHGNPQSGSSSWQYSTRNANLPFPRHHPSPLPPSFAKGEKQTHTKNKNTQKNPKRSMLIEASQQGPSHQPGHFAGSLGGVRLKAQRSTLQGPLRAGSSAAALVTRNQWPLTEASPAADPNLSVAIPLAPWVNLRPGEGRRHGARHPQPGSKGLILSGAWTRPTKTPVPDGHTPSSPTGTGKGSWSPCWAPHLAPPSRPQVHSLCIASPLWPKSQFLPGVAERPPLLPVPSSGAVSRARAPTGEEATGPTGVEGNTESAGGQRPHRLASKGPLRPHPTSGWHCRSSWTRWGDEWSNGRVGACCPDGARAMKQAWARAWGRPRVPTLSLMAAPRTHG